MTLQLKIELESQQAAESVLQALEAYKEQLRQNIARTERRLQAFEERYGVSTSVFITEMTAEDLVGGDLDYIEWSGEFELLKGLQQELQELDRARYQLQ
jgi:Tfp pilus assembly protein PilV